jgi:beta-phosphoglucomutase
MAAAHTERCTQLSAVIFDVDGVLVESPHERAWRHSLTSLITTEWGAEIGQTSYTPELFTTAVYQSEVAGKPRLSGARAALEYFRVPQAEERTPVYAAQKQRYLEQLINAGVFVAFPDGVRFVRRLLAAGVHLAAASSSKNANEFLRRIPLDHGQTLLDVFTVNVCGRDLAHGKPDPEIFLLAARELEAAPASCIVVEDAPAGVQAGRAAGMATIGVARVQDDALLEAAGADLVVRTLDEVDFAKMLNGRLERVDGSQVSHISGTGGTA